MTEFFAWLHQTGEGCGYTIGCGQKFFHLNARTREEATKEIKEFIVDHGAADTGKYADRTCDQVLLLSLEEDMTLLLESMKDEDRKQCAEEERNRKLKEFEKRKKDLGL